MKKIFLVFICSIILFGITGCKTTDLTTYKGIWKNSTSSIPDEELIINSIDDNKVKFDYIVYRLTSFEGAEATLKDNIATFDVTNDLGWNIKGTITLDKDNVVFKIDESSNDLIQPQSITFTVKSDKSTLKDSITNATPDEDITSYKGVWRNDDSSSPTEELIINSYTDNKINFDYLIDGITTFEGVEATLKNNTATFDVKNDLEWNIKGNFVMHDNQVDFTITESSNEYIEPTTITYKLHREKSNLK